MWRHNVRPCKGNGFVRKVRDVTDNAKRKMIIGDRRDVTVDEERGRSGET